MIIHKNQATEFVWDLDLVTLTPSIEQYIIVYTLTREKVWRVSINKADESCFKSDGTELDSVRQDCSIRVQCLSDSIVDGIEGAEIRVIWHEYNASSLNCPLVTGYDTDAVPTSIHIEKVCHSRRTCCVFTSKLPQDILAISATYSSVLQ